MVNQKYSGKSFVNIRRSILRANKIIRKALDMLDSKKISVWLDDERPMPGNFDVHVKTPEEAIDLLKKDIVEYISLDHDLGLEPDNRNGYMVAKWIEEAAFNNQLTPLAWNVHSQNPTGRKNMANALMNADKFWARQRDNYKGKQ